MAEERRRAAAAAIGKSTSAHRNGTTKSRITADQICLFVKRYTKNWSVGPNL